MARLRFHYGRYQLAELGERLGLAVEVSESKMPSIFTPIATVRGVIDGVAVAVQRFPSKRMHVDRAVAACWPPLDLGLSVRLEGAVVRSVRDLFGSADLQTGDGSFDHPMRVQADEPERARGVLTAEVRRELLAASASCDDFSFSDLGIRCKNRYHVDKDWERGIPALVASVRALRAGAANVPPAATLVPWVAPLGELAAAYGLLTRACPLAEEGTIGSLPCAVFFRRIRHGRYALQLGAAVAPPDPLGPWIAPRRPRVEIEELELAKPMIRPQEIATGDASFDAAFVVRAVRPRPDRVAAALPDPMRRDLLALLRHVDVSLRHGVISLRSDLLGMDPRGLRSWVDAAVDGVRTIVPSPGGGYRGGA